MPKLIAVQLFALLLMLGAGVISDLRERRIPNKVTVSGLAAGLVIGAFLEGGFPLVALGGAGLGLLVGFTVHAFGGFGAGDAKLLAAVGAFVGAGGIFSVFVFGALAGGVFVVIDAVRRGTILGILVNLKNLLLYWITGARAGHRVDMAGTNAHTVPYGVAIAAGAVLAWIYPLSVRGMF